MKSTGLKCKYHGRCICILTIMWFSVLANTHTQAAVIRRAIMCYLLYNHNVELLGGFIIISVQMLLVTAGHKSPAGTNSNLDAVLWLTHSSCRHLFQLFIVFSYIIRHNATFLSVTHEVWTAHNNKSMISCVYRRIWSRTVTTTR